MAFLKKRLDDGIVRADPLPSPEELADYYARQYYQDSDGKKTTYDSAYTAAELEYKTLESRLCLQAIQENRPEGRKGRKILELGCGEGFFLAQAAEEGADVKGVDFSSFAVEKWNPAIAGQCVFGDIYAILKDLSRNGETFDVCVLRNVLEHVIDPPFLMDQIRMALKEDGLAVITVPNDYSDIQKLAMDKGYIDREFWFAPPDHLFYFNTENISPFMQKNGFGIVDMFSSFPVDFFLFHPGSNYIADRTKGKAAHHARIDLDLLMAEKGLDRLLALYRAMAGCGVGRDFTVVLKKTAA